jgi:hypothetical protein
VYLFCTVLVAVALVLAWAALRFSAPPSAPVASATTAGTPGTPGTPGTVPAGVGRPASDPTGQ